METNFPVNIAIRFTINLIIAHIGGLLVRHKGIKPNYIRKINHFTLFFLPIVSTIWFPYDERGVSPILGIAIGLAFLAMYVKPVRERAKVIQTAFLSFDRPEDRPHTLRWLVIQYVASYVVLIPILIFSSM